jgi:hypothetical protein
MKKRYPIFLGILLFLPSIFQAKTLVVRELGKNGTNSSIQAALLKAIPNDTILVDLGRFSCWQEDFQLNFPVILRNYNGATLNICGNIALNLSDSSTIYFSKIKPTSVTSLTNQGKVVLDSLVWNNINLQATEFSIYFSDLDGCNLTANQIKAAANLIKNTTLFGKRSMQFCGNELLNSTINAEVYERSFLLGNKGSDAIFSIQSFGKLIEFASNYLTNPTLNCTIGAQFLDTIPLFQIFNNHFNFTNLDNKWGFCIPFVFSGNQKNMLVANNFFIGNGNSSSFASLYSGPAYPYLCKWNGFEKRCLYNNFFSVTCVGTNSTYRGSSTNSQTANGLVENYDSLSFNNYFTAYNLINDSLNLGRLNADSTFKNIGIDLPEFSDVDLSRNDIGPSGGPYPIENFWDNTSGKAKVFWVELPRKTPLVPSQIRIKSQSASK